jgi:dTDP-glucose 4,6-dehydratase
MLNVRRHDHPHACGSRTIMRILVTGAAGFIGSNFVRYILNQHPSCTIVSYDALTYAGNLENLKNLPKNHHFVHGNICDSELLTKTIASFDVQQVVHFAAESHVDRSIMSTEPFTQTNIVGTQRLLDAAKAANIQRFVHVSTDEVYGSLSLNDAPFTEDHPIVPNSPYAASKAASDLLVRSYIKTFDFPAMITRCSNNYGPYQFPEKLIPLMVHNARNGKSLPVYGAGDNIRDWVHVSDHCAAIAMVLTRGELGEVYNIGGNRELTNIDIVKKIIHHCGANESLIEYVTDRPGHDFRYAMDIQKINTTLGYSPCMSFEDGLASTIEWYKQNDAWLTTVMSGEYRQYIKEQYQ